MLGPQDIWVALALGMFFFGAKKLPELSRSLGQAMTEFKKGLSTGDPERPAAPAPAPSPPDAASDRPPTDAGQPS